jgi:hypothetical protein
LPEGIRQDTRKHTRHCLRPDAADVAKYLAAPSPEAFEHFAKRYRQTVEARFAEDRTPFDALAELARQHEVHLGCSCPTKKNPDVRRCHTQLALSFMAEHYPDLRVHQAR